MDPERFLDVAAALCRPERGGSGAASTSTVIDVCFEMPLRDERDCAEPLFWITPAAAADRMLVPRGGLQAATERRVGRMRVDRGGKDESAGGDL